MTEQSVVVQLPLFLRKIEADNYLVSGYHLILNISPSDITFTEVLLFRKMYL